MKFDADLSTRTLVLALLLLAPLFLSLPTTSGQTIFITVTSRWTSTAEVTFTSTSFTEFPNRTVTTVGQLEFADRLPATNGTNTCVSDHYPLSGLTKGLNINFFLAALIPVDFYILSQSTFSAWAAAGAHCDLIPNPMVKQLGVSQLSPLNFTTPSAGDYEILIVNTSSSSEADYVITVAYPASIVVTQSNLEFLVTAPTTVIQSLVLNQPAYIVHPSLLTSLMSRIIDALPILIPLAIVVVVIDLLRREIKQRRKKSETEPAPQEVPKSAPPS